MGKSDSKHSHAIIAAHGPKKLAAVVAAVRTVQFMDRCAQQVGQLHGQQAKCGAEAGSMMLAG